MTRIFSKRSLGNMHGVHPDLIRVAAHALQTSPHDFVVIEGVRSLERQRELVKAGKSWTMNSRHLHGLAIDLMAIHPSGGDPWEWKLYAQGLGPAMKAAAEREDVPIIWGGDWTKRDGVHFELDHKFYPDRMKFPLVDPATVKPRNLPGTEPPPAPPRRFLVTIPTDGDPTIEPVA